MLIDYKKIDLFGKSFLQKLVLKPPFDFTFPVAEQACFLYMLAGEMRYHAADDQISVPANHSLLLNCVHTGQQIKESSATRKGEIVIITFHPEVLKKIYDRELPLLFQPSSRVTNQSRGRISNDFLIQKYMEGLLFYFDHPSLINDEILVLKLKEIILLLAQTQDAEMVRVIVSQLFSQTVYTFKQIIAANLFLDLSVGDLAQQTNLSVSSFKREFKKLFHDSPANYIKNKRLERSAELLAVSEQRITDIAFDCGFKDLANFTKSFRAKYNVSPTTYRLQHNNG